MKKLFFSKQNVIGPYILIKLSILLLMCMCVDFAVDVRGKWKSFYNVLFPRLPLLIILQAFCICIFYTIPVSGYLRQGGLMIH